MKIKKITVNDDRTPTYDIEVPDTHDYVLSNGIVVHNSTISSGTTNGVYPIREFSLIKTSDTLVNHWVAPDSTRLKNKYQLAWDISTSDMIKVYSIMQKWCDQGISADLFVKIQGDQKVSSSSIVQDYLDMVRYGMKSRYYVNSLTSKGVDLSSTENAIAASSEVTSESITSEPVNGDERGCASGACSL